MDTNVSPVAFPGDPGHEGGSQPMRGLKGTCSGVHIQAPDGPFTNSGSAVGGPNDTTPDVVGWDSTSLATTGGSRGVSGNDSRSKTT